MVKITPISRLGLLFGCLIAVGLWLPPAEARIGESQSSLEGRLLRDRTAVKYRSQDVQARLNDRSVPYRGLYSFFPGGVVHELYFKPAEDSRASRRDLSDAFPEGWTLHVVYWRGQSVFEAYRRNGSNISSFEEAGLLSLVSGDSYWKRIPREQAKPSAFGYNFEREDGRLRALRSNNYLIIFRPEFDELVLQEQETARAEREARDQERAPDSLQGF